MSLPTAYGNVKVRKADRLRKLGGFLLHPPKVAPGAPKGKRPQKILLICNISPSIASTFSDMATSLAVLSSYDIDFLNLDQLRFFPSGLNLSRYAGLVFHYTLAYNPVWNLAYLDKFSRQKLADYSGKKIIMLQDEYHNIERTRAYLRGANFDTIFTIANPAARAAIYPPGLYPNTRIVPYLTGYVSSHLRNLDHPFSADRPVDMGYRGNTLPPSMGRLAFEKGQIGADFLKHAAGMGLTTDISGDKADRYIGEAWFDFMGRCKGVLGTESGTSILDWDGSVEREYTEYLTAHPNADADEVFANVIDKYETGLKYNVVAPRHLEAAACNTVQIMYEGEFQGIFQPWRHYLPLKTDWSNFGEVMERFFDPAERRRVTACAYEEIVMNPAYSVEGFVKMFDEELDGLFAQ